MSILLVIPPAPYLISDKVFPSLGILYVASALEAKGHAVDVLDLTAHTDDLWKEEIRQAAHQDYQLIGVTATTPDFPLAVEIASIVKGENTKVPIVIGGPHPTVAPHLCNMFDKVVIGDGWTGIFAAMEGTEKIVHGAMVDDFDTIAFPARHLIDMDSYRYEIDGRRATNVMSQLGCPFGCTFCCGRNIKEYRKVRVRTPENFIRELDFLHAEYGYTAFMVHDDEFNLLKDRTLAICKALEGRDFRFRAFIKAELFTDEIAAAMSRAGFAQVDTGVESGSARILKSIQKNTTPEANTKARDLARKHGMKFKAFISVGHPSETHEDAMMTKQWLLDNKPDFFEIYVVTPYPGAPIFDQKEKFDLHFTIDYSQDVAFHSRQYGYQKAYTSTSALTGDQIVQLRNSIDKEVRATLGIPSAEEARHRYANALNMGL